MVSAISPARRAVRIAPVAAVSAQLTEEEVPLRRRFTRGGIITVVGIALLAWGLTAPAIALVGLGAVLIFVGVAMLAPAVARPMASGIGRPLARLLGVSGRLGRENSMRSPRRTAQTSSALMVGLALVSAIAVFGASLSRSATASVDNAISADLIVSTTSNGGNGNFSEVVPRWRPSVPGVTATTTVYGDQFEFRNSLESLLAIGTKNMSQTVILNTTSGSGAPALAAGDLLVDTTTANSDHLTVGETVPVKFALTGHQTMRIGGIYQPNALVGTLPRQPGLLRAPLPEPAARRRPVEDRRQPRGAVRRSPVPWRPTPTSRSSRGPSSRRPSRPR